MAFISLCYVFEMLCKRFYFIGKYGMILAMSSSLGGTMIELGKDRLTLDQYIKVVREKTEVYLSKEAKERVNASRRVVENIIDEKRVVYGINTGFGKLADHRISETDIDKLQLHLLVSHACGLGDVFSVEVVRGMMLLRVNALIQGYSGIRLETVEQLLLYLNQDIVPVVYEQGSLGASGDLVPLAHMALPLIGKGEVFYQGKRMTTMEALRSANIKPIDALHAKEGLALINGTQAMTAVAALNIYDAFYYIDVANKNTALVMEALQSIVDAFDERVQEIRLQSGQMVIAKEIRQLLAGSSNITHQGEVRVQDAYSIRCVPQVHGASLDTLYFVRDSIEREMNAVTDNPLIFENGDAVSAGNFHGQPIALAMDYLAIAMSEIANISERRLERLVNPHLSDGLPAFLVEKKGLNSGFMIVQYAAASLVSENKVLTHPASVDSIPSSANQEDHVSMGTISARKASKVLRHVKDVLALELFTVAQALDFRGKQGLSPQLKPVYDIVREEVPHIAEDCVMQPLMQKVSELLDARKV